MSSRNGARVVPLEAAANIASAAAASSAQGMGASAGRAAVATVAGAGALTRSCVATR